MSQSIHTVPALSRHVDDKTEIEIVVYWFVDT